MDSRKTSQGFAKVSINVLKYVIMVIVAVVFATAAFNFGSQVFSSEGMEEAPGTDMTVTLDEGTTIKQLGKTLEEYQIIKDSTIFRIQALLYEVKGVEPGTYTFNTSDSSEEILKIISAGPEGNKKEKETSTEE